MNDARLDDEWQLIASLLPAGWQELARSSGALRRSRKVQSAEVLLRLILLHVSGGLSLRQAVVRAKEQGLAELSDVALLKRLRRAGDWLCQLNVQMAAQGWPALGWPLLEKRYRLRAIDASQVQEPGATGTDWRVHYSLALPSLCCDHFEITDSHGGESLERFAVQRNDLLLADRGYCRAASLAYVTTHQADYVVRFHSTAVPLAQGKRSFSLLRAVRSLHGFVPKEWRVEFTAGGKKHPARLCAIERSAASTQAEREQVLESARKSRYQISEQSLELAGYILVLSSLPQSEVSCRQVLDLYRLRWQIELAFKRLKSLLQVGHLPKYDPLSSRAWLQAKLLTALLVERLLLEAKIFSPWGFPLPQIESLESVH